jgi:hypothetical protein
VVDFTAVVVQVGTSIGQPFLLVLAPIPLS